MQPPKPINGPKNFRIFLILSVSALTLLVAGCMPPKPNTDPSRDAKARAMVMAVREQNAEIATTKGSGQLDLEMGRTRERFRMAWAAQGPDRLRLTLLASGHPVETIAASGEWVSIVSHTGRHTPHHTASTDPDLTPYIGMPVRLSDMVTLLLGRFPLQPFDRAWFVPGSVDRVRTSRSFSGRVQEISFDDKGRVAAISLLDRDEALVYQIDYTEYQTIEGRVLPKRIFLTTASGRTHDIRLLRILPNAVIKPAVFRLTASGS